MLSKSLSTSEKMAKLYDVAGPMAEFCQSLYPLVVAHSDDYGRLHGDAFTVKMACLPISPRPVKDFALALQALDDVRLIRWYEVDGKAYIQVLRFDEHQPGLLSKRTKSKLPEFHGSDVPSVSVDIPTDTELPSVSSKSTETPAQLNRIELNSTQPNRTQEREPREERAPSRAEPHEPLIDGKAIRRHGEHVVCFYPDRPNLCVTRHIHDECMGKVGGELSGRSQRARAIYSEAIAELGDKPCGENALDFWQNVFAAKVPNATARAPASARGQTAAAHTKRAMDEVRERFAEQDAHGHAGQGITHARATPIGSGHTGKARP